MNTVMSRQDPTFLWEQFVTKTCTELQSRTKWIFFKWTLTYHLLVAKIPNPINGQCYLNKSTEHHTSISTNFNHDEPTTQSRTETGKLNPLWWRICITLTANIGKCVCLERLFKKPCTLFFTSSLDCGKNSPSSPSYPTTWARYVPYHTTPLFLCPSKERQQVNGRQVLSESMPIHVSPPLTLTLWYSLSTITQSIS